MIRSAVYTAIQRGFAIANLYPGFNLKNLALEEGKKRRALHCVLASRHAGRAVVDDRDMPVSLLLVRPQPSRGMTLGRRPLTWMHMEDEIHG